MLIEFRVANFRSFNSEQVLSFVASRDTERPDNLIGAGNFDLLKTSALFGANASGKSNLVKAIGTMQRFVCTSASKMNIGDPIEVTPFRLSRKMLDTPSVFETTMLIDDVRYSYGFAATRERVHDEWLIAYPRGRAQRWLERKFDPATNETAWAFRGDLGRARKVLQERTRENGLVLARGAELNVPQLKTVFLWFQKRLHVVDMSDRPIGLQSFTLHLFHEDKEFRRFANALLQDADTGITEALVKKGKVSEDSLPAELPADTRRALLGGEVLETYAIHKRNGNEEKMELSFDEESNGTQRLFALAGPWWDTLRNGYTVIVDELECSMHPLLVRKLIELFQSPAMNERGAQLLFATHDSSLMDLTLFRRDQFWIVEKGAGGGSQLYRLSEFDDKPRKGEALEKRYLSGRYGGVPVFGQAFEDI